MRVSDVIKEFPEELQGPVTDLVEVVRSELGIPREEFNELKEIVKELAVSQKELAEAQKRSEERLTRLEVIVEELAEAQKRTEERVEALAEAMEKGIQRLENQISALGNRWGIRNENVFRNTIRGLLTDLGYTVSKGCYAGREIDVIIRNGEHILLEITSRMNKDDIKKLNESADDYLDKHGIDPKLMVAAIYIPPSVFKAFSESPRPIEIFSDEED